MGSEPQLPPDLQPAQREDREVLESWKEIAALFDVSVRTAQLWEQQRGMPVRRTPGQKGRIFAYVNELLAWRDGDSSVPPETIEAAPAAPRNLRWLYWLALVFVLAVGIWAWRAGRPVGIPSSYRIDGQSLIVSSSDGSVLWTYRFDEVPDQIWESDPTHARPLFADLDGDGEQELLLPFNSGGKTSTRNGTLLVFTSSGAIKWSFRLETAAETADGRRHAPPFLIRQFALVPSPGGGPTRVLAIFTHVADCPSAAVLLDARGSALRQYWHAGHLAQVLVTDLLPGGGPEIYLGAISNGYNAASLIVLDPERFQGASAEPLPRYRILHQPPPRELARIVCRRLRVGPLNEQFNQPTALFRQGSDLILSISEGSRPMFGGAYSLTLGPRLQLKDLTIASTTYATYRRLFAQKLLPYDNPDREIPGLKDILYLTPWPPESAPSAAPPQPPSE